MTRRRLLKRQIRREAFTLIEIMVVVMIIGMLAALVGVNVMDRFERAKGQAAAAQIANFVTALENYRLDNNRYPTTEQGLHALVVAPPNVKNFPRNGYLNSIPFDPWDNNYIFFSPGLSGQPYTIESYGADGIDGGESENADIESWRLGEN